MNQTEETKRGLVEALLRLNGLSKNKAALTLNLRRQNLYAWLNGVDSAIANSKKLELLDLLGIRNGQLKDDQVHRWRVTDLEDARSVISSLTEAEAAPQQLFVLNIWPANETDAILRLTTNERYHVYVLLYYPPMETPPVKITADALGFGVAIQSLVVLTQDQWRSWLTPDEIDLGTIARIVDLDIESNAAPEPLEDLGNDEQADVDYHIWQDQQNPPSASPEQSAIWNDLLDHALMSGRSFEQIIHETKTALNLYPLNQKRRP